MTNQEKYKTAKERGLAFRDFCRGWTDCEKCPAFQKTSDSYNYCNYVWLEFEAQQSATEVADILDRHSHLSNYGAPKELVEAIARASELLRKKGR